VAELARVPAALAHSAFWQISRPPEVVATSFPAPNIIPWTKVTVSIQSPLPAIPSPDQIPGRQPPMARTGRGDSQKSTSQWRQKSITVAAAHDWQADRTAPGSRPTTRRKLWRRVRVAALLIFGVVGGAGLLALLLHREVQFPFVAVVKTAYRAPFPPNA